VIVATQPVSFPLNHQIFNCFSDKSKGNQPKQKYQKEGSQWLSNGGNQTRILLNHTISFQLTFFFSQWRFLLKCHWLLYNAVSPFDIYFLNKDNLSSGIV
jgi:hypothetical protein